MSLRPVVSIASALALGLSLGLASAAPAHAATTRVVASGLDNPRHVFAGGGAVYVAESGRGGTGPCEPGPDDQQVCLGMTGAITKVARGQQTRVVTGLPSIAGPDGGHASGPADVDVIGVNKVTIAFGLGGTPDTRAKLGPDAALLGTLATGRFGQSLTVIEDLAAYEAAHDPDGGGADSNPGGIVRRGNTFVVTDAGANDVLTVPRYRDASTLAVLPESKAPIPPFLPRGGTVVPVESVPTDVAVGPDGAFYVAELNGFPFPVGGATIWRVVPGAEPTAYATGLTSVTGLAWKGNTLYAVQYADRGLFGPPIGSVRRVTPGGTAHEAVVAGLKAPYGIAIQGNTAYVTTGSDKAGQGALLAVTLR